MMVCVKAKGSLFGAFHACKVEYLVAEKKWIKTMPVVSVKFQLKIEVALKFNFCVEYFCTTLGSCK